MRRGRRDRAARRAVGDDITPDTASVLTAADGTTGTFTAHHAVIAALFPAES
ncbi:hypothetical protein [Streptomyces sp. 1222.5]|uniref:hypothetical protein n=1 Tax=Streptomyces sp. 1222.5 TaxID=1881026 RepID=UPI000A7D1DEA